MIARFASTTPLAALVTGGVFLGMVGLIHAEFAPAEPSENADFEIAPVVEDIETMQRRTEIDPVERIDTPPPPPRIDVVKPDEPTVPIAEVHGGVPDFDPVALTPTKVKLVVPDADATPIVRVPPQMPARAERSGHCDMLFDVTPDGAPYNIAATCSDSVFKRPSIKAVGQWKYKARVVDGSTVSRSGVRTRIAFDVTDARGHRIPE